MPTTSICGLWRQHYKMTAAGNDAAVSLAIQALEIDPSCASAAALIGWCRQFQAAFGWGSISTDEIGEAVRLATKAVEIGKDDPDVLWMGGFTLALFAGDHATATDAVNRALVLNPNSAYAWSTRG